MSAQPIGLGAMGIVSALGAGRREVARRLFAGRRDGLVADSRLIPGREVIVGAVCATLPASPAALAAYDSRNNRMMLAALRQIAEPIRVAIRRFGADRIAVVLGTSTSGIDEAEAAFAAFKADGAWPRSFHYRQLEFGSIAEYAARALGVTGPAYTIATACSSSGKVFASARRLIRAGIVDAAIVGGADTLARMTLQGFAALEALSRGRCNPFSANRDGINIGEGAAAFLMSRDPAEISLLGVGESSDAYHVSAPDPAGAGAIAAMRGALDDAGLAAADVAYVNLHGTATPLNDAMEGAAVNAVFGPDTPCSSTKAMTGHTLGAAGACEAAFLWLALSRADNPDGALPPHLWDGVADARIPPIRLVARGERMAAGERAAMLSNSFAFGGNNVSLILGRGRWR